MTNLFSMLKIDFLCGVDYSFGAIAGIIKGVLLVSVLLLTLTEFLPKDVSLIKNSLLSSHSNLISEKMVRSVQKDMGHNFLKKIGAY
jgi:membrane protein required for colicin V production